MDLPMHIQMAIEEQAQRHKREIAEGFAKLRKELIPPEPEMSAVQKLMLGLTNQGMYPPSAMLGLAQNNPFMPYGEQSLNYGVGVLGALGNALIGGRL